MTTNVDHPITATGAEPAGGAMPATPNPQLARYMTAGAGAAAAPALTLAEEGFAGSDFP